MTDFPSLSYSYFEKGCQTRCTLQSRKVLWVVLSSRFSKETERMTREAMDICLRGLKESNKSRFDSRSVRNSVLIISHITFRDCLLHIFSDNLSRNSSVLQLVKSPPPFHIPKAWKNYPFGRRLLVKAIIGSTPPGDLHYLKEKLHVYTINDIQLLKMGEQEHPRLEGSENLIIL